jgi:hypothetical protein
MSQHDQNVANDTGAAVRGDINNALAALFGLSSGATAPATTLQYQLWADTTSGLLKQRNAANTGWLVRGTLAETFVIARSSDTILGVGDHKRVFIATGTFTQTLTAAATLGDDWWVGYRNDGTGVITVDPNSTEQIDGGTTITLQPGEACLIYCNGSAFKTIGRRRINDLTEDATPDGTADYVETWDASAGAPKKVKLDNLPQHLVLIEEMIASASASITFTTGIDATFDEYVVQWRYVKPASAGTSLRMRCSTDGGSVYDSGANYVFGGRGRDANGTDTSDGSGAAPDDSFIIAGSVNGLTTTAGEYCHGSIRLVDPSVSETYKSFRWEAWWDNGVNDKSFIDGAAWWAVPSGPGDLNALQFFMATGNIAEGVFTLYGVRK